MPLRTLQRPRFVCVLMGWALSMKTLERQRLHSNAERWNDEIPRRASIPLMTHNITNALTNASCCTWR